MSLEQQIANLVDASNNLTNAVNGKLDQIDNKMVELENAVPNTVKSMLDITSYVDAVNGSDSNPGTSSQPFKTLRKAIEKGVSGSTNEIYLKCGQSHAFGTGGIPVTNQRISFWPWGNDVQPEITFSVASSGAIHQFSLATGSVFFRGIKLIHPYRDGKGDNAPLDGMVNSLFTSQGSDIAFDYAYIGGVLTRAVIDIGDNHKASIISAERSHSTINLNTTDIVGTDGDIIKFRTNGSATLRVSNVGKDAGVNYYPEGTTAVNATIISNV